MKPPQKSPCGSCPYRVDVPSGVWSESEYVKLPEYDQPTGSQPAELFGCHQQNGHLCAGWAGCHDMYETLAIRIASSFGWMSKDDIKTTLGYSTSVELFSTGQEACEHGLRDIEQPGEKAQRIVSKIANQQ